MSALSADQAVTERGCPVGNEVIDGFSRFSDACEFANLMPAIRVKGLFKMLSAFNGA